MSTGEEIQYEIRADASQMRSEFAKVKSSLSDVKNKTKETELSLNSFGKSLGKFGTLIKGLFAAMLVRTAIQFAEFAGRVDSVSQAFYNLTGKSRAASDALVQSISEAANGTMSNLDIMQSSSLALQLMGEKVADQLPQMARIALASARATGQDASQLYNDIIVAAGRQSVMILDNLGISSVTAGQKQEEFARRLGKTREQLTETEKRQAFFYAVMEAGNELISRSGMGVITLGERIQRLKAQGENAATTLAQNLVPALNTLTDALIDSGGKTGGIVKQFSRLFGAIIIGAAAAVDVLSHMNTLVRAMNDDVNARNISAIGDAYRRFAEQARAAGNIEEARRYFTLAQQQYQRSADLQRGIYENTSLRSIQQRARSAIAELNRLAAGTDLATGATQRHTDAQRETAAAVHNTSREVASLQSKYAEFLRGDNNISFLNEADYDVAAAKLEEEYERLSDARDASGNLLFSEEQRMRLWETYLQRGQTLLERTNYFVAGSLTGIQSATQTAFSSIDKANQQLIYNMMWGKGGWNQFKESIKDTMKTLMADIAYAIARAAILQAVLTGTGLATGGASSGIVGGMIGGLVGKLEKGGVPAIDGEKIRIPIYASGHIPNDHFLSYIAANEAVINARSTAANAGLLKWINDNPGRPVDLSQNLVIRQPIYLDGKQITEVVDTHRLKKAHSMGVRDYDRRR